MGVMVEGGGGQGGGPHRALAYYISAYPSKGSNVNRIHALMQPVAPEAIAALTPLVSEAANLVTEGKDATTVVEQIREICGREDIDSQDFFELWGAHPDDEYAEILLLRRSQSTHPLTDDEIKTAIDAVKSGDGKFQDAIINFIEQAANYLLFSDLIFYPHHDMNNAEIFQEIKRRICIFEEEGHSALDRYYKKLAIETLKNLNSPLYSRQWATGYLASDVPPFSMATPPAA